MKNYFSLIAVLILALSSFVVAQTGARNDFKPTVILISADGFRPDYLDRYPAPTLNRLASAGIRAEWMETSFPAKTFPNHYSVATGLYPANHGIVDNNVWDFGTVFSMGKREEVENPRWWLGEPIWVTAQKQGQIAASYFFVGSEAPISGVRPKYWRSYNGGVPPQLRVDTVLGWLDLPVNERPTLITMYFSDTDDAGHEFGPDSAEAKYAVTNVDGYIARLEAGLKSRGITDKVNIIFVSDHGMAPYDVRNATYLDDYFDLQQADRILWSNEIVQIFPKEGMVAGIIGALSKAKNVSCWRREDVPPRFHYSGSSRIAPIICVSAKGWVTTSRARHQAWLQTIPDQDRLRGAHGYDPQLPEMRATFIGSGPAFKSGLRVPSFPNVDVYEVICKILRLRPAKNDGNPETARRILR